ncbi:MAG: phage tail tape measure protein [Roseburia sp.]|nr:phage tail tape measure protein [Roseburia sp.]
MAETVRIEVEIGTKDETEPDLSNVTKKLDKMSNAATKAGNSSERAREKVSRFDKSAEKTQRSLSKWAKEKYEVLLEAKERITPVLRTLRSGIGNFTGRTWRVTMKAVDLVTAPVRGILNILKNPVFQVGAVLGVSIGLKDTIDTYKDFEAAMSQVSAVSGATGSDLDKLTEKAKIMGANTKFTATEAAEGFNYMAMAGWKTKDMLDGIEGIMSLAAASGEDLATTSDIVTDALTAFNLQASDSSHFADVLAAASSNANTNVSMLGESFKYVAPVAGTMKYRIEDVSLALGLMANASVKGSMAGTSLKTAIANMSAPTSRMESAMKRYNISLKDNHGKMKSFKAVLDNIRGSLGNLSKAEKAAAAKNIFGKEAMGGMLTIVNASEKDYNKLAKAINNADGASAKMADTMLDNLQGSITLFQSALDSTKMSLGERIAPYVRGVADWLTEMMPSINSVLNGLMDHIERKVTGLRQKFKDMSDTSDWENADFFGKVSIAWDEFIANPFKEWWNDTGKASIANTLGDFGGLLGSGLNAGILTLLGFDVSGTQNEAASIGASFAKGFADGFDFDEISSKLWEGFKNILSNASKLLPGGKSADLSSLMSAALLAKIAGPLFSAGSGGIKLGKALLGSGGSAGGSIIGSLIGSAGAGSGILGFGANTAINLGAGNLAGGASLSAGALSAVGLGSVAGGVAGAAGLVHGGMDLYKGFTSDDEERAAVYKKAGAVEVGGTLAGAGAGAATGAAIGALFGGVGAVPGALIGAGIGAVGSWIAGNKIKSDYEDDLEAAQEAAERAQKVFSVTGRDIKDVRFETKELRDAVYDTEVTTEEFAQKFQAEVVKNMEDHFGDISLSLKEVQEAASEIAFDRQTESITMFTDAAQKADSSLSDLQSSIRNMKKANWQVGLSTKLSKSDKEQYRETIDSFVKSAADYIEGQHYEATVALELLVSDGGKGMTGGLDSLYSKMQKKIEKYSDKLDVKVKAAMKDGIIDIDEEKEIAELQEKITNITNKLSVAQEQASFSSLKIKYNGAALDTDSFASMQQELQANVSSMTETYDNALQVSLTNLQLQLDDGAIDQKTYEELYQKIADGYNENIKSLQDRVESFQLDSIADAYSKELEGILPDIEGTTSERLKEAMDKALAIEPEAVNWTDENISKWFGLDKLDIATQTVVSELLKQTAVSIPDSVANALHENLKQSQLQSFTQSLDNPEYDALFLTSGTRYGTSLTTGASNSILAGSAALRTSAQSSLDTAFADPFSVTANVSVTPKFNVPGISISASGSDKALSNSGSSSSKSALSPAENASGGYVTGRQLSWLAEEGYGEWVIPTNPSRRARALELYRQAGESLGVQKYAEGGFVSQSGRAYENGASAFNDYSDPDRESASYYPSYNGESDSGSNTTIELSVTVNPEFVINGAEGQDSGVVEAVKSHIREIADEVGGEIASQLEASFSNRPLKEA